MPDRALCLPDLPEVITLDQARAALAALGLPRNVRSLTMHATEGVTVTLLAQDTEGQRVTVGDDALHITAHVPYGAPPPSPGDKAQ